MKPSVIAALVAAVFVPTTAAGQTLLTPFPGPLPAPSSSGGSSGGGGGTITGGGVAGQVSFWSGATAITGDTGFTYDAVTGVVVNELGVATLDFRAETDTDINGIFLDSSAETIDFVGGSASTGCSISSAGLMTCAGAINALGGDAAATPNFFVDTGEGMYDGGADILAFASAGVEMLTLNATEVVVNETSSATVDFRAETDVDVNGIFLDASADTLTLLGGSASTGCDIAATGAMTCTGTMQALGGDAAATPNFFVDTGEGMYDGGSDVLGIAAAGVELMLFSSTAVTINSTALDRDFRVSGDTDANMLTVDASADRAGVGVATPSYKFEVRHDTNAGAFSAATNATNGTAAQGGFYANNGTNGILLARRAALFVSTPNMSDAGILRSDSSVTNGMVITAGWDGTTPRTVRIGTDDGAGNGFVEAMRTSLSTSAPIFGATVFNETQLNIDFRVETDTDVNGIFLDASAETLDVVGGSGSTGATFSALGGLTVATKYAAVPQAASCAAGVLALDPTSSVVNINANTAACVITIGEANALLSSDVQIILTSNVSGAVTFPNVANVHIGPTLCTTTGLSTLGSTYRIHYAAVLNAYVGVSCEAN